jgi:hypothetical protein
VVGQPVADPFGEHAAKLLQAPLQPFPLQPRVQPLGAPFGGQPPGHGHLDQPVQLELPQDPVHEVALRPLGLPLHAAEGVDRHAGQRRDGRLVVVAERLQQGLQQLGRHLGAPGRLGAEARRGGAVGGLAVGGCGPAVAGRRGRLGTGQWEAHVEQDVEGPLVLRPLDQGGGQRGPELSPVGQVDVAQAVEGVNDLHHRHRHPRVAQPVEEFQQRGLQGAGPRRQFCPFRQVRTVRSKDS